MTVLLTTLLQGVSTSGYSGFSGISGYSGYSSTAPGTSGYSGYSGAAITITDDTSNAGPYYPAISTTTTGSLTGIKTSSTKLTFSPSTGTLNTTVLNIGGNTAIDSSRNGYFNGIKETAVSLSGGSPAINLNNGDYFYFTATTTTVFSISNTPSAGTGVSFILEITNGGSYSITYWASIKWAGASAPVLTAAGRDVLGFFTRDGGTTWNGILLAKDIR